jgi:hypothetical protein
VIVSSGRSSSSGGIVVEAVERAAGCKPTAWRDDSTLKVIGSRAGSGD